MNAYTRQNRPVVRQRDRAGEAVPRYARGRPGAAPVETAGVPPSMAPSAAVRAIPAPAEDTSMPGLVTMMILALLFPIVVKLGPIVLFPYRVFLLVAFIPLLIRLFSGQAGKINPVDCLMMAATLWAGLALAANHPVGQVIEPFGIYTLEFFGAYLVGRVCIRSAESFMLMVKLCFTILVCLLPFAIIEALTNKNILLDLMPSSIRDTNQGIRLGINRAQTIFAHSIHYGVFGSVLLGLTWYAYRPDTPNLRYFLTFPIVAFSTFLSLATGALIAFNIQLILIAWAVIMKPVEKRWVIFGWLCVAGYVFVDIMATKSPFHTIVAKLAFSQTSAYNRILIFDHGMKNVMANPLLGLGMNDWVRPSYVGASTDNFWLLNTMRYGIPFFIFFTLAIFLIIRRAARQPLTDPLDRACRAGYLTAFGGIIISGGTVDYWKAMLVFILFIIGSGVWIFSGGAKTTAPPPTEDPAEPPPGPGRRKRPA